jgi:biopolymer transport protein ExbD
MIFIKRDEEEPRIGVAPLIDIVFLLLIFFMVTSHFDIASGIRIDLPGMAKRMVDENKVTLIVDKSAQIYLEGEKIDPKELEKRLREFVKNRALLYLVLQADKDVSHGDVVRIMDIAKSAGVPSIIIAARWKKEDLQ